MNLTTVFHTKTPCYYPLSGYGKSTTNEFTDVGTKALYYSSAPSGDKVVELYLQSSGSVNAWYTDRRSATCSVRCVKEN